MGIQWGRHSSGGNAAVSSVASKIWDVNRTNPARAVPPLLSEAAFSAGDTVLVHCPNDTTYRWVVDATNTPQLFETIVGPRRYSAFPPVANFVPSTYSAMMDTYDGDVIEVHSQPDGMNGYYELVRIDPAPGEVAWVGRGNGVSNFEDRYTLSAADIANGYVVLGRDASTILSVQDETAGQPLANNTYTYTAATRRLAFPPALTAGTVLFVLYR